MVWVVETGIPKCDAPRIVIAPAVSAREAVHRAEMGDVHAHRLDDPPSAGDGAHRDGGMTDQYDPGPGIWKVFVIRPEV